MKRFLYLAMLLPVALVMLYSCNEDSLDEEAVVSVDGLMESHEFEAESDEELSFSITSDVDWYIKLDGLDWVDVSPGRGAASSSPCTVVVTPHANTDSQPRSGVMTIVAGDYTKEVTLNQKPDVSELELVFVEGVEDDVHYVDAYNIYGSSLKLYSNCAWTAEAEDMDEWAVVGPLSGGKGRYATISVTPLEVNDTGEDRFGEITFSFGDRTKVLRVCQKKFVADLKVLDAGASVTSLQAFSIGQSIVLNIDANAEWTVTSSAAWVRTSVEGGNYGMTEMTLDVEPNETRKGRTATLSFVNHDCTIEVNIVQGAEYISVSAEKISVAKDGGTVSFKVSSGGAWTAESSESWITLSPAHAEGDAEVVLTVAPAPDDNIRTATVRISSDNQPAVYEEVTVTQSATYVDITVPVLFNSSQQNWNMTYNPDYASSGATGAVTGKGSGRLCSYTYPENEMIYAQVVTPSSYGLTCIMAAEGNITFKKIWTDDAIEFHIPVVKAEKGRVLHFDYGLMATLDCPMYWNSEVSLDGGETWSSFATNVNVTAPNGRSANSDLPGKTKVEKYYNATYTMEKTVEKSEIIVRIICVDGSLSQANKTYTGPANAGTVRFIGADHDYDADANKEGVVKGPKIYLQ